MNNNLKDKIYLLGFLLILSLPLLAFPPLFHPPAWGKTIIFKIILSFLICFFIYQIIFKKDYSFFEKLKPNPIRLTISVLIALLSLFLISTLFSQDSHYSFWGSPYRAGGFLNFAFYIIFAVLIFLTLKPKQWNIVLNFSLIIAILVSFIALIQQFEIFKDFLISYNQRPPSTLGSPIFLALYLCFFVFLSLSNAILKKTKTVKTFYFLAFLIIVFSVILTGVRAVFFGLMVSFSYFVLFYPDKKRFLKTATLIVVVIIVLGVYCLNLYEEKIFSHPLIAQNPTLQALFSRFKIGLFLEDPRFSFWQIGLNSLKEKPLLGYGPENFSIAYDKYYDPLLPHLDYSEVTKVDRAHSFIFDIAVTSGIPTLLIFLFLFGIIFWQLEKVKKWELTKKEDNNFKLIHGIQTAIIAYFFSILFSFDTFDTYLIFFMLVGYCLNLTFLKDKLGGSVNKTVEPRLNVFKFEEKKDDDFPKSLLISKAILMVLTCGLLIWFVWFYNLKPLFINKELNWAEYYSLNNKCQKAIEMMEKILPSSSFIDNYVLLKYSEVLKNCQKTNPEKKEEFILKSIEILEKAAKSRPTHTRTWLILGTYLNSYVENKTEITKEEKEKLLSKADSYFIKALTLNPKGQIIFVQRSNTYILWGNYQEAKKIAENCLKINPRFGECWFQKALSDILLNEFDMVQKDLKMAKENKFDADSKISLSRLLKAYILNIQNLKEQSPKYYQPLIDIYQKLILFEPKNFQYHASLAYVYKMTNNYEEAKKEALKVLELSPESEKNVKEFLKTLP